MCEVFSELGYALVLFFSSTINVGVGEEEPRLFWEQDVTASSSGVTRTKRNDSTPRGKQGLITLVSKLKWMAERVRNGSGADNPHEECPSVGWTFVIRSDNPSTKLSSLP